MKKLIKLKKLFTSYKLDGYLVPKNDEYFNEYVKKSSDRLKFISDFSGSAGFAIILKDKNVKSILINIFGGIVRCDRVAEGVVQAVSELNLNVPVVVRLEGTNAENDVYNAASALVNSIIDSDRTESENNDTDNETDNEDIKLFGEKNILWIKNPYDKAGLIFHLEKI